MTDNRTYIFPKGMTVLKKLGEGGTAEVFLVQKEGLARPQAVKIFTDQNVSALIKRECDISRLTRFPGFVQVFERGMTECGNEYISMEYCPGQSLDSLAGNLTESQILNILSSVSAPLQVLHSAGYVHNDLKPENIYCPDGFSSGDFKDQSLFYLKLSDFSLARKFDTTANDAITGTIGYMSPEMILKQKILPVSDIFSMGVMAYYLACGKLPFTSECQDPLEVNALITEADRPAFSGPGADYSKQTRDLISALLSINSNDRPQSAFELMQLLSKAGSRYPYRKAIRPRSLLFAGEKLNGPLLLERFGPESFSKKQLVLLSRAADFDFTAVRLILEYSFNAGKFARLDGSWGWDQSTRDILPWPRNLSRLSMRCLRGTPYSVKKLVMMLATLNRPELSERVLDKAGFDETLKEQWARIPSRCKHALLHSTREEMSESSFVTLSAELYELFKDDESFVLQIGRLLYDAGRYSEAVKQILSLPSKTNSDYSKDELLDLYNLAEKAAIQLNQNKLQAEVVYERAMVERDVTQILEAEKSLLTVVDLLADEGATELAANSLRILGNIYKEKSDHESGIRVLDQAKELYRSLNNQLGLSQTLNNLGNIHWIAGKIDSARKHYLHALEIQRALNSEKEIASTLSNIGSIDIIQGRYQKGIEFLGESLKLKQKLGDKSEIARTCNNLGVTYLLIGDLEKSINAMNKSYELNKETGNKVEMMLNCENLAESNIQAGSFTSALEYLKEADGYAEDLGEVGFQSTVSRLTGLMLRRMGKFDQAEQKLKEGLDIAEKIDNPYGILPCYLELAKLYYTLKEPDLFSEYYEKAKDMAVEVRDIQAQFHLALLNYQENLDEHQLASAQRLLLELKTPREKSLLALCHLEKLKIKSFDNAWQSVLKDAEEFFSEDKNDIDLARMCILQGRVLVHRQDPEGAEVKFQKALKLSTQCNLLPEQWKACCWLSELAFDNKKFEESFSYARQTIDILKTIAGSIAIPERMQKLYSDDSVIHLLGRIKSLQAILGNKKGTAVAGSP